METQKERLIQVRRRTPAEVWDKAIAEYLAGARASEVAAKYGVSAHSIYQRVSGRGKKKKRQSAFAKASPDKSAVGSRQSGAEPRNDGAGGGDTNAPPFALRASADEAARGPAGRRRSIVRRWR